MSDLTADDRVGIVFCVVLSLLQFEGRDIVLNEGKVDVDQYISTLYVFEQILCYRQFLKLNRYWERDDNQTFYNVEVAIEKLLNQIITLMPRTEGNEWAINKIHEQLDVAENIKYYGAHSNVHTGPQEHNHIKITKLPSKQVQRKKVDLDWQLAN